jgi:hypothetical protein
MEMRGEEINFSNLEKNIRSEFDDVKKNMEKHNVSGVFERIFSATGQIFISIGSVLGVFAKVIAAVFAVIFISIGLVGLLGTVASLFMGEIITRLFPMYSGLSIGELLATTFDLGSVYWVTIPAFLVVVIPFLCFILLGLRMVVRFRMRTSLIFVIVASVWIMSVMVLSFTTFLQARSFTIRESVKDKMVLSPANPKTQTIRIMADDKFDLPLLDDERTTYIEDFTIVTGNGSTKMAGKPIIYVGRAEGTSFELIVEKESRGASRQIARQNAERIEVKYTLIDSSLVISPYFILQKDEKWRAQEVKIFINVPEGKKIYFDKNIESLIGTRQDYCEYWPEEMIGNTWVMKGEKLEKEK